MRSRLNPVAAVYDRRLFFRSSTSSALIERRYRRARREALSPLRESECRLSTALLEHFDRTNGDGFATDRNK
jgi:hypothetical protein